MSRRLTRRCRKSRMRWQLIRSTKSSSTSSPLPQKIRSGSIRSVGIWGRRWKIVSRAQKTALIILPYLPKALGKRNSESTTQLSSPRPLPSWTRDHLLSVETLAISRIDNRWEEAMPARFSRLLGVQPLQGPLTWSLSMMMSWKLSTAIMFFRTTYKTWVMMSKYFSTSKILTFFIFATIGSSMVQIST